MKKLIVAASLALIAAPAMGADAEAEAAIKDWIDCKNTFALMMAASNEPAPVVADAAMAMCDRKLDRAAKLYGISEQFKQQQRAQKRDQLMGEIIQMRLEGPPKL